MKYFHLIFVFFLSSSFVKAQEYRYAPALSEIFMNKDDHNKIIFENPYFVSEIQRITKNLYYGRYFFSLNISGSEKFSNLSLVVVKNKIFENIFNTGITLDLSEKHDATYDLTYWHSFTNDDYEKKQNKIYNEHSGRFRFDEGSELTLVFPLHILNPKIKNTQLQAKFVIHTMEIEFHENENQKIIIEGNFSKAFYLREVINSLHHHKITFEIGKDFTLIKIPDENEEIILSRLMYKK